MRMFQAAWAASQRPGLRPTRGSGEGAVAETIGVTGFGITAGGGGGGGGGGPRPARAPFAPGGGGGGGGPRPARPPFGSGGGVAAGVPAAGAAAGAPVLPELAHALTPKA